MTIEPKITRLPSLRSTLFVPEPPAECIEREEPRPPVAITFAVILSIVIAVALEMMGIV
jgi:hypothetical protein